MTPETDSAASTTATTRRAIITGASSGIGAATVRLLRQHGWDVVGVARRADRLQALAAETGADVFVADVTVQDEVDALRDYLRTLGPIHALVNNAGGALGLDSVESSDADDWIRMFDVNVVGVKRVTSALLPLLRAGVVPGASADILTVTSIAGHIAYEGGGGYVAAKHALASMVGVLRLELAGEPIRVTEIAPGMVHTDEFSLVRFAGDQAKADAVYDDVPNPLYAEDIAAAIVHMLELPFYVNLDLVTIKPVAQAAPHKVIRGELRPR
ncbi:oxidoreductase [Salinibacterium xinjiangense]|uniref:NADP-dependent 3-hydroxy acid dehydrogenase YdfG n=1 Tax=Salinibacterium xinjiangense TaxID=386302 RepID=A0A2C8ZJR8_9MICO|nr:SDR family NAD(P)-dependent oxidoreductase [Salinibacterium xinjiangense]GGK88593.1 oxidoreductase [Salinibacterium xinjiangense]SOE65017.1 NADP-dependent 3-hydroxy acid dehydrogenase YdfG [Salinibacterium xinjiangense]